jgi:hypothetical protein
VGIRDSTHTTRPAWLTLGIATVLDLPCKSPAAAPVSSATAPLRQIQMPFVGPFLRVFGIDTSRDLLPVHVVITKY